MNNKKNEIVNKIKKISDSEYHLEGKTIGSSMTFRVTVFFSSPYITITGDWNIILGMGKFILSDGLIELAHKAYFYDDFKNKILESDQTIYSKIETRKQIENAIKHELRLYEEEKYKNYTGPQWKKHFSDLWEKEKIDFEEKYLSYHKIMTYLEKEYSVIRSSTIESCISYEVTDRHYKRFQTVYEVIRSFLRQTLTPTQMKILNNQTE